MKRFPKASPACYLFPGLRSPFGKVGGMLTGNRSPLLGSELTRAYLQRLDLDPEIFDGVVVGEVYTTPTHPSPARYIAVETGFRNETWALNVSNNCASGFEAIIEAARQIMLGEAELVLVVGQESTTNIPIWLNGVRQQPQLATIFKLMQTIKCFEDLKMHDVELIDGSNVIFIDPNIGVSIAVTAEILAQNFNLTREELDDTVRQSYMRAAANWDSGRISRYIWSKPGLPARDENLIVCGDIERLSASLARTPSLFGRDESDLQIFFKEFEPYLSVPLQKGMTFSATAKNCAPKADGAGVVMLASERGQQILAARARGLGEPLLLRSWSRLGVSPALMGLGMATSALQACERIGIHISEVCQFELHEAFASSTLAMAHFIQERTGFDMRSLFGDRVNPNGGSLAIGHSMGAAGIQLALGSQQALAERPQAKRVLSSICAGGGVGASIILERC